MSRGNYSGTLLTCPTAERPPDARAQTLGRAPSASVAHGGRKHFVSRAACGGRGRGLAPTRAHPPPTFFRYRFFCEAACKGARDRGTTGDHKGPPRAEASSPTQPHIRSRPYIRSPLRTRWASFKNLPLTDPQPPPVPLHFAWSTTPLLCPPRRFLVVVGACGCRVARHNDA